MTYLWQKAEWPSFNWSNSEVLELLVTARFEQGRLLSLGSSFVHSYEISEIKSPIYTDIIEPGRQPMTFARLAGWQASLFPTGYAGIKKISVAELRTKDLSRSSLPQKNLKEELEKYLHWWTEPPVELDPVVRSAMAFFWFMLISPFEAGNFELACALSELALQEAELSSTRLYDISVQLMENKSEVLQNIEARAKASGDITEWILFYLRHYTAATRSSYAIADKVQKAEKFWKNFSAFDLNSRQRKILNLMLEENCTMTNREFVDICNTSRESAKRDLAEMVKFGILKTGEKKGRSVTYSLP
jgi:Fic family protein